MDGQLKSLLVHRKGSTRAFPPHHPLIPVDYQLTGQPVLIGGTMGTCSYVLTGAAAQGGVGGGGCLRRRPVVTAECAIAQALRPCRHPCCPSIPSTYSAAPGTEKGMEETFGSTCHGAGRARSRNNSRNKLDYQQVGVGVGGGVGAGEQGWP